MTLPQEKIDSLNQLSQIHGIPIQDLVSYYEKHLADPNYNGKFKSQSELLNYIDSLIVGFIGEFANNVMDEVEMLILDSSTPRESKNQNYFNRHLALAKRTSGDTKMKWLSVMNMEETGEMIQLPDLSTGKMKISITKETDQTIEAFSRTGLSNFTPQGLTWVSPNEAEKKDFIRKIIKPVEIAQAGKNLSLKLDGTDMISPFSLRLISGTISSRRLSKKVDDETRKERESGIINIVDKSVALNPDFFKNKTITDPKDASKTKIQYGGFAGFCEPDDIRNIDRGTQAEFIGYITSPQNMNVVTIWTSLVVAPKTPTQRLKTGKTDNKQSAPSGINPAAL